VASYGCAKFCKIRGARETLKGELRHVLLYSVVCGMTWFYT